jgi:rubredoxin
MIMENNFDKVRTCPACGAEAELVALYWDYVPQDGQLQKVWHLMPNSYKCSACGHRFGEEWKHPLEEEQSDES